MNLSLLKDSLTKFSVFVKHFYDRNVYDIMIFIIVALLILLSFGAGFIVARNLTKEPIQIEQKFKN